MVSGNLNNGQGKIVITPNRSANWPTNLAVILAFAVFLSLIATAWAILGLWVILPFAGLELGLLSFFLYRVSQQTYRSQVLLFNDETIVVEDKVGSKVAQWRFQRDDGYFKIQQPNHPLDGSIVFICDDAKSINLSTLLNKEDREQLVALVKQTLMTLKLQNNPISFKA